MWIAILLISSIIALKDYEATALLLDSCDGISASEISRIFDSLDEKTRDFPFNSSCLSFQIIQKRKEGLDFALDSSFDNNTMILRTEDDVFFVHKPSFNRGDVTVLKNKVVLQEYFNSIGKIDEQNYMIYLNLTTKNILQKIPNAAQLLNIQLLAQQISVLEDGIKVSANYVYNWDNVVFVLDVPADSLEAQLAANNISLISKNSKVKDLNLTRNALVRNDILNSFHSPEKIKDFEIFRNLVVMEYFLRTAHPITHGNIRGYFTPNIRRILRMDGAREIFDMQLEDQELVILNGKERSNATSVTDWDSVAIVSMEVADALDNGDITKQSLQALTNINVQKYFFKTLSISKKESQSNLLDAFLDFTNSSHEIYGFDIVTPTGTYSHDTDWTDAVLLPKQTIEKFNTSTGAYLTRDEAKILSRSSVVRQFLWNSLITKAQNGILLRLTECYGSFEKNFEQCSRKFRFYDIIREKAFPYNPNGSPERIFEQLKSSFLKFSELLQTYEPARHYLRYVMRNLKKTPGFYYMNHCRGSFLETYDSDCNWEKSIEMSVIRFDNVLDDLILISSKSPEFWKHVFHYLKQNGIDFGFILDSADERVTKALLLKLIKDLKMSICTHGDWKKCVGGEIGVDFGNKVCVEENEFLKCGYNLVPEYFGKNPPFIF